MAEQEVSNLLVGVRFPPSAPPKKQKTRQLVGGFSVQVIDPKVKLALAFLVCTTLRSCLRSSLLPGTLLSRLFIELDEHKGLQLVRPNLWGQSSDNKNLGRTQACTYKYTRDKPFVNSRKHFPAYVKNMQTAQ